MSGLDTMHDILQDPEKRRPWAKRFEMLAIVFSMSGAWIAAGYAWGHKTNFQEVEFLRADYQSKLDKLREAQGRKLEDLQTKCAAKAVK